MKKRFKFLAITGMSVFMFACSTVPLTGRRQLNAVGDQEMVSMADQAYKDFLRDPKNKIITNSANARKVKEIGARISSAVNTYLRQNNYQDIASTLSWEFNLVESKEVNAWCMPGGKVAVYTGILPVTQDDTGLATVMGHEVAHAIARHSNERASQGLLANGIIGGLGAAMGQNPTLGQQVLYQAVGIGGQLGVLSFSRKQELEADRLGLTFMAMAGYNPQYATSFWRRMAAQKNGQQGPPEFLSTHPSDETRIADIQKYIPEAQKFYKGK